MRLQTLIKKICKLSVFSATTLMLAGCVTTTDPGTPVESLRGPSPVRSWTPMDDALSCLRQHYPRKSRLRLAVNDFKDGTGQLLDQSSLSKAVSQRPDMMMIVALGKTGVRQVNRSSLGVAEWEMKQALAKRLGDQRRVQIEGSVYDYRPVLAGALTGSSHFISGAITELNWNIRSNVGEIGALGLEAGGRLFRVNVAIDLMLTNTTTTEIVTARSYTKQIVGIEFASGLFRFFNVTSGGQLGPTELFQFNLGEQMNEPTQTALRWVIEAAAYDIIANLAGLKKQCERALMPGTLGVLRPGERDGPALPATPRHAQRKTQVQLKPNTSAPVPREAKPLAEPVPDPVKPEAASTPRPAEAEASPEVDGDDAARLVPQEDASYGATGIGPAMETGLPAPLPIEDRVQVEAQGGGNGTR
ncbi:MAG: hypothetical protein GY764_01925 [Halieaceae bacterium]|nr:hypothetical protein [Halieaceae bacterium]